MFISYAPDGWLNLAWVTKIHDVWSTEAAQAELVLWVAGEAEPYRLGLTLLVEMKKRHPEFAWNRDGSGFDRLVGTRSVRAAIDRGDTVDAIVAASAAAVEEFRRTRRASLLY